MVMRRSTGNGLYVLHSCMNHSCEPNIEVHNEETNANVHLVAKRPIEPGTRQPTPTMRGAATS